MRRRAPKPIEPRPVAAGDRLLLPCVGGRAISRLVTYPPPLEIEVDDGVYVLVDDGPVGEWHYQLIAHED